MLESCNGLRLADSVLRSSFNLGLSFLDGEGVGYVSSLLCSQGGAMAAVALAAAMASGRTLGEAAALINALLYCRRGEYPGYLAIGQPDFRVTEPPGDAAVPVISQITDAVALDFGSAYLGEILVRDGAAVELASYGSLGLRLSPASPGEQIYWFARPERRQEGIPAASSQVRLFLFRFPEALGRVRLALVNRQEAEDSARRSLAHLRRWLDFFALAGLNKESPEVFHHLQEMQTQVHTALARMMVKMSNDASAWERLQECRALVDRTVTLARDEAVDWLAAKLLQPFWPTNLYTPAYLSQGLRDSLCPNCQGPAITKGLKHPLSGDGRQVTVCPRCGIVSDLPADGPFTSLVLAAPGQVGRGQPLEVEVLVETSRPGEGTAVLVCPRISAVGLCQAVPAPPHYEFTPTAPGREDMRFRFVIPPDLPPHRYFLKAVAASASDLAFASRVLFVT
jgi:hypothetical protein